MKGSSSSTEAIAGLPVVRRLGESTWEAVQPELDRRVALRRMPPGTPFRAAAWPDRAGVVPLYAVVEDTSGTYAVTAFVPGARTLAELGGARPGRRHRWLDRVAAVLDGTVHGDLTPSDILIDPSGRVVVTGFGRGAPEATAAGDAAAIARMRPEDRRHRRMIPAAAVAVAAAVAGGVLLATREGPRPPVPPAPAGTVAIGSALTAGALTSVDCEGRAPGGDSLACSILQGTLAGRPLVTPAAGTVRSWAVRGVRGRVRLQVLVPAGRGGFRSYVSGPFVEVPDDGAHRMGADLSFPAGARFALELAPGTAVGLRDGVAGARTLRFFGALRFEPRVPDGTRGADQELLLRVDVVPRG
ncbi:MAG: hypothetical protein U0237_05875 [Thermoleophilia bacterium]